MFKFIGNLFLDGNSEMRGWVPVVGFIVFLLLAVGGGAGAGYQIGKSAQLDGPAPDLLEEQYYRGQYDICSYSLAERGMTQQQYTPYCLEKLLELKNADWYGQGSPGWQWPLSGD